jgi:hypothetical protein
MADTGRGRGLRMTIIKIFLKITCSIAFFSFSALSYAGSSSFTSSATFIVPAGVNSVRVLLIGGGGAGAGSHYRGGGSGFLNVNTVAVVPGASIPITVGAGGLSAGCAGNSCTGGNGGASSIGVLLQAAGGIGGGNSFVPGDGNGGSGGGGAGNSGFGGAGGSAGSDGVPGNTYPGGVGQGTGVWTAYLAIITTSTATGGAGGIPSTGTNQGGGGGGGILLNGSGPSGSNGGTNTTLTGAFGGVGYGAGGGSGGFDSGSGYAIGGNGAPGLVYVEWNDVSAVVAPVPTLSAYGLVLTMLALLFFAGRRLRGSAQRSQPKID